MHLLRLSPAVLLLLLAPTLVLAAEPAASRPASRPADRTPEAVIAEMEAVAKSIPRPDRAQLKDEAYAKAFAEKVKPMWHRVADLQREFYERFPTHPLAGRWMFVRANNLLNLGDDPAAVAREFETYLHDHPDSPLKTDALYAIATARTRQAGDDPKAVLQAADAFVRAAPKDPRAAELLFTAAGAMPPSADRLALYRRIVHDFPDSSVGKFAAGKVRQAEQTGKPFELTFTDFVTGKKVSMADFRGKVVLVEFWATWCPPCVADLPNIVALHDKYAPKGFTIISVSLDQKPEDGGDQALKEFLKQHPHPWPQYYQGNSFDSEFSSGWGINAIPALFIVDQNGNLHTTHTSRAEEVEPIINDLLSAKK